MTPGEIDDIKARNPCADYAMRLVALRKHGAGYIGPCPVCSPDRKSRDATRFEVAGDGWVCAVCCDGGDVIRLAMKVEGLDFKGAIERLGGARPIDAAQEERLAKERAAKEAKRQADNDVYRQRERGVLYDIWRAAVPAKGTPVEGYLARRGLVLPEGAPLRCVECMPFFAHGGKDAPVLHRGPAMVAPIVRSDGKFAGLHFTWIDLAQPKWKARIVDPETGAVLNSRKVRGSKAGNIISLVAPAGAPEQLVIGEGIEKVLAVWLAMRRCEIDISRTWFCTSVDLGNLGGPAADKVTHPTLLTENGRAQRVPGPTPDLEKPGIVIPDTISGVVILGDSTSDRVLTECSIHRAMMRWRATCAARVVRVAWAPPGVDFDDVLRGAIDSL